MSASAATTLLDAPLRDLLRLQNVATRRRDRISSDEEERQRQGYEVRTTVQFTEHEGRVAKRTGLVSAQDGTELLKLEYGQAATIWRVNLGWTRRKDKGISGSCSTPNAATGRRTTQPRPTTPTIR